MLRLRQLQEVSGGTSPGVHDQGNVEGAERPDEGYVRNHLVAILKNTKVIDHGLLDILTDISKASLTKNAPLLHIFAILIGVLVAIGPDLHTLRIGPEDQLQGTKAILAADLGLLLCVLYFKKYVCRYIILVLLA